MWGRARGEGREASGRKDEFRTGLVGGGGISGGGEAGGSHDAGSSSGGGLERFGGGRRAAERVASLVAACSTSASG